MMKGRRRSTEPLASHTLAQPAEDVGWRTDLRGTIGLISNRAGVVEIGLRQPIRAWIAPWPIKVRRIAVSVADPDGLIAALS